MSASSLPSALTVARNWGTTVQAAALLGVSRMTVRRMIDRGEVYAERVSPRLIRIDLASIQRRPLGPAQPRTVKRPISVDERIIAGVDE